jgi:hypothetical protein
MKLNLWVAGQALSDDGREWAFVGVYSTEEKAVAACLDWRFWVAPIALDFITPPEESKWPGCYYPKPKVDSVT